MNRAPSPGFPGPFEILQLWWYPLVCSWDSGDTIIILCKAFIYSFINTSKFSLCCLLLFSPLLIYGCYFQFRWQFTAEKHTFISSDSSLPAQYRSLCILSAHSLKITFTPSNYHIIKHQPSPCGPDVFQLDTHLPYVPATSSHFKSLSPPCTPKFWGLGSVFCFPSIWRAKLSSEFSKQIGNTATGEEVDAAWEFGVGKPGLQLSLGLVSRT